MTDEMIALRAMLENGADADMLREMIGFALNTRPRKTLSWKTPAEALDELLQSIDKGGPEEAVATAA
ncbi:hypothetical protein [Azospirillum sp. BE72]|uniref:hypothetical protein n=1 Tax=Azospirillum sp. BE72 TaxID=2817776 RepID=UPI0028582FB5|nr:hypothetical protein [Azospirillum sp. BE72]MDR6773645.1 hypothetical protein [Azospirillum sp. BE72]